MPRLSTPTYLHRHHQLKELWLVHQRVFSYLSPTDQSALHRYFQFASDKTEAELLEHRRDIQVHYPSLPQRAGRAYAKLMRGERAPVKYTLLPGGRRISVRSLVRPEPNFKLLAIAIRHMAEREVKERVRRRRVLSRAAIRATYPQPGDAMWRPSA